MKVKDADILFVPGSTSLDERHWLARWQGRLSTARRVEVAPGDVSDVGRWSGKIAAAVAAAERPVVLVAHGSGATTVIRAAGLFSGKVAGAFLVAPALAAADGPTPGYPTEPLPFPSIVVASRNDPDCDFALAEELAAAWGSLFIDAGHIGAINAASGHGPWPEGSMTFARFVSRLSPA